MKTITIFVLSAIIIYEHFAIKAIKAIDYECRRIVQRNIDGDVE